MRGYPPVPLAPLMLPVDPAAPEPLMLPVDPVTPAPLMLEPEPVLPIEPLEVMPSPATPRPADVVALLTLPVLVCDDVIDASPVDAPVVPPFDPVAFEPVSDPVPVLLDAPVCEFAFVEFVAAADEEPLLTPLLVPAGEPSAPVPAVAIEPCVAVDPLCAFALLLVPLVLPLLEVDEPLVSPEPPPAAICDDAPWPLPA